MKFISLPLGSKVNRGTVASQPNCNQCLLYTCVSKQQCAFRHVPRLVVPYVSSQNLQQQSIVLDRSVWSIHMCKPFAERQALGAMIV